MSKAPHLTLFASLLVIRLAIASHDGTIALQQPTHFGKGQIALPIGLDRLDVSLSQNELERLALRDTLGAVDKPLGIVDDFTVCVLVQHAPELRPEDGGSDNVLPDIWVDDCLCKPEVTFADHFASIWAGFSIPGSRCAVSAILLQANLTVSALSESLVCTRQGAPP